jgi:hypothetical protein
MKPCPIAASKRHLKAAAMPASRQADGFMRATICPLFIISPGLTNTSAMAPLVVARRYRRPGNAFRRQ